MIFRIIKLYASEMNTSYFNLEGRKHERDSGFTPRF